ncbi:S8 family serine peptidase [Halobaculum sp. MBLA0143]|uniref:S8 family serine peptidase n=1 Tax=Halobaculum sp. MBLA0143 TaxID=3079933 RepID=UPI003525B298
MIGADRGTAGGSGSRRRAYLAVVLLVAVTTSGAGVASPGGLGGLPGATVVGGESAAAVAAAQGDDPVRVGVIGSAFAPERGAVAQRVVAQHDVGGGLGWGRPTAHDTAVAEVVAERSPSAALYLAGVGSRPTADRYAAAVEWLLEREVDVIVDAGSYFPRTAAGLERFEAAARSVSAAGAVFVTSAGNYADRHWRGSTPADDWVQFRTGVTRNRLAATDGRVAGPVTLRLYWQGEADYDLYLYRDVTDGPDHLVARSVRETGTAEAIDTQVRPGDYYVRVHADEGTAPVDLFAARHDLTHAAGGGGTLPPATAPGVVSVGAVTNGGTVASYSGDGDVSAVDTVVTDAAGEFRGTSAATPVVAGTVTEVVATTDGRLSPGEVETIIRETADGEYRQLDPDAALARANRVGNWSRPSRRTGSRDTASTGADGDETDGNDTGNETDGTNEAD